VQLVHLQQVGGEQRSLVPARAGSNLQNGAGGVVGVVARK
jgi:hypothetical protein